MTVESDGLIHTHGGMGLLYWTGGKVGNCKIHIVYRMRDENDNSGVFIRIPVEPREEWMPVHYGFEVQIDNHPETSNEDEYHSTGVLYSLTKPLAKAWKPGPEWNTMDITLDGPRTIVVLNGIKITDYKDCLLYTSFLQAVRHGLRPRFAQCLRLRLSAALGHGLGEIRKQQREPQPNRDLQAERKSRRMVHDAIRQVDACRHRADLHHEHHRISPHLARIQFQYRVPHGPQQQRTVGKRRSS